MSTKASSRRSRRDWAGGSFVAPVGRQGIERRPEHADRPQSASPGQVGVVAGYPGDATGATRLEAMVANGEEDRSAYVGIPGELSFSEVKTRMKGSTIKTVGRITRHRSDGGLPERLPAAHRVGPGEDLRTRLILGGLELIVGR